MMGYYVKPLYKMLDGMDAYRSYGKRYTYTFDGDDELVSLNDGISEVTNENITLRKRLKDIKSRESNELESNQP